MLLVFLHVHAYGLAQMQSSLNGSETEQKWGAGVAPGIASAATPNRVAFRTRFTQVNASSRFLIARRKDCTL